MQLGNRCLSHSLSKQKDYTSQIDVFSDSTWSSFVAGVKPQNVFGDSDNFWVSSPDIQVVKFYLIFKKRYQ